MKKNFFYAMMSAIALTSAVSFTGCASDDGATVENNPTYDGSSVRTDFAFSITKASQGTRMTADAVQEEGSTFRGMVDMYLFPFSEEPSGSSVANSANFPLGELTAGDITSTVGDNATQTSSKVYSLVLPLGTNNFLFYGKAKTGDRTSFEVGKVSSTLSPTITHTTGDDTYTGITYSLESIRSGLGDDATKILAYLNAIVNAKDDDNTTWASTKTMAESNGNYRSLASLYTKFTSNAHPRAGSAEAVVRTVLDLYKGAKEINGQSPEAKVVSIANAICAAIDTETSGVKVVVDHSNPDPDKWTATISGVNATFPSNLDLPMGAAQLYCDVNSSTNEGSFSYVNPSSFSGGAVTGYSHTISQYRYPSELIYFDNSPLRATDKYKTFNDYPKTANDWDTGFSSDWVNETVVSPSTRAVAMTNNVNYGVAMLETKVKLIGGTTDFNDNRAAVFANLGEGTTTNQTDIDATKFIVTGLLIGGQPATVGWDMTNPGATFKEVIYDKFVKFNGANFTPPLRTSNYANFNKLGLSLSSPNYTIVFDNYASGDQKNVLIALEIKNGLTAAEAGDDADLQAYIGKDFYGYDGLIPAGSTFYLVGTLNPTHGTTGTTDYTKANRQDTYRITKEDVQRVFMQDYKTVANISLSQSNALKRAYSTIPDLRSTEIVFGLSVDLTWETGVRFDVTIN